MEIDDPELARAHKTIVSATTDAIREAKPRGGGVVDIVVEPWAWWHPDIGLSVTASMPKHKRDGKGWLHHPDFVLFFSDIPNLVAGTNLQCSQSVLYANRWHPRRLIVEIDGSIHNKKGQQTIKRNRDYDMAGISFITVNTEDAKEAREKWENELYHAVRLHMEGNVQ